jgi:hypothetical protein
MNTIEVFKNIQELFGYVESTMAEQNPALAKATRTMLHTVHSAVFDAANPSLFLATPDKEKAV